MAAQAEALHGKKDDGDSGNGNDDDSDELGITLAS